MTGFNSKRDAAADKFHWSDCAVHNAPAYPAGPCDCGAMNDRQRLEAIVSVINKYLPPDGIPINDAMSEIISLVDPLPPQPAQEPQYEFLIDDLADWKQYVEADNAPYGLREHVTKVLLAHGIKEKNK